MSVCVYSRDEIVIYIYICDMDDLDGSVVLRESPDEKGICASSVLDLSIHGSEATQGKGNHVESSTATESIQRSSQDD
jgi:hypothetical protein